MNSDYFFSLPAEPIKHTKLYGLDPQKMEGGSIESLQSYCSRLAYAHRVSVSALMKEIIFPEMGPNFDWAKNCYIVTQQNIKFMTGTGSATLKLAEALERLTGKNGLTKCTIHWMLGAVASMNLIESRHRYCPLCYESLREQNKEVFDQLLWNLHVVEACPVHGILLQEKKCCAPPARQMPALHKCHVIGYCTGCGKFAYGCNQSRIESATDNQLWVAKEMQQVLNLAEQNFQPEREIFMKGLQLLADKESSGSLSALARHCAMPKSIISRWKNEPSAKIAISSALQICSTTNTSLAHLLQGNVQASQAYGTLRWKFKRSLSLSLVDMENTLKAELNKKVTNISLMSAAKKLGIRSPKTLRRHFPDLCRAIVKAGIVQREAKREIRRTLLEAESSTIASLLIERKMRLTLKNASILTGQVLSKTSVKGEALLRHFRKVRANERN